MQIGQKCFKRMAIGSKTMILCHLVVFKFRSQKVWYNALAIAIYQ